MLATVARTTRKFVLRERSSFAMLRWAEVGLRFLAILLLLGSWGLQELHASTTELTQKLVSSRSARTIPHRFTIVPNGVSLAPNQTQRFGVTDAQGNPVAVHWNISGLHCAGLACGNIDAEGNYSPPASLSRPLEITLEGVVISDPNYSVMTRVEIVPGASPTSIPVSGVQISDAKTVAAPPVEKAAVTPNYSTPNVISAAPKVDAQPPSAKTGQLPLPSAVAATPVVMPTSNSNRQPMPPVPDAVAAAPVVKGKRRHSDEGTILLDVPSNVSNLTVPKKPETVTQRQVTPSRVVASAPGTAKVTDKVMAPVATTTAPTHNQVADLRPLPSPAIAPQVAKPLVPTSTPVQPSVQSSAAAVVTTTPATSAAPVAPKAAAQPTVVSVVNVPIAAQPVPRVPTSAPVVASDAPKQMASMSSTNANPPMPTIVQTMPSLTSTSSAPSGKSPSPTLPAAASAPTATSASTASGTVGTVVTYRDGQLRIDAENTTLAEVLKLVAKKMGAMIDVPPGSGEERIVEHVGPGHPNDVLTQLLNGSHFNFIIVNSALHPNEPAEVLLSMQSTDTSTPVAPPTPAPTTSALWTPPDPTLRPVPLPPQYDSSLTPPANRESLTPDAISELMRAKAKELRERAMQQAGTQPDTSQPPQPPPAQPEPQQAPPQQ